MFEVGKYYTIKMWEDTPGEHGLITEYGSAKALDVKLPLVKFRGVTEKKPIIINTASIAFISATEATTND